jgi:aminoglycoside phosphotransferase family enzyme/predicted kinase
MNGVHDDSSDDAFEELGQFLATPQAYPEPTERVECRETHISRVYLTDQFAYKLKKPVRFDFLDFSTLELRHQACLAELRLNRRLAKDVYLDVLPITRSTTRNLQIGGDGTVIDWLVKMRRLNDPDTLLAAIQRGNVSTTQIASLATLLAGFYRNLSPLPLRPDEYREEIERHVRGNLAELLREEALFTPHEVRRIHSAQLIFLTLHSDNFDARIDAGRIVEGHGDLRPEHVYLASPPAVIDCIEFNAEFRHIDVLDELSFLETECAMSQAGEIGAAIRERCMAILSDQSPMELAAFYKSYRACVRAKVAVLRARQLSASLAREQLAIARQYLDLADQFGEALGPPILILVRGLSGTGKSTIAQALADRLGTETLHTDTVRKQLVSAKILPTGKGTAKYSADNRQLVYDAMLSSAEELLAQHASVILDGTFLSRMQRDGVATLANRYRARWLIVHCQCPVEVAQARVADRLRRETSLSEAQPELVEQQVAADENDHPEWPAMRCDTTRAIPVLVQEIMEQLGRT